MDNTSTEEKLRKLASIDAESADRAWGLFLSGQGSERSDADELLDIELYQRLGKGYPEGIYLKPPSAEVCGGQYRLGTVLYPNYHPFAAFGLREDEWIRHMLITGMTGAGKTTLAFHLLGELSRHGKPFLVFDWKRNYRDLLQLKKFQNLRVFTVGRNVRPFRFNPLIPPPGSEPGHWLLLIVDVIKHAYFVGEGVEYLLREAIDWVYEQCGVFQRAISAAPTFQRVMEYVAQKRLAGRMGLWKASTIRVLASLNFEHGLGPVTRNAAQDDLHALFTNNAVLELDALSDVDKVFLTEALILWLYELRKSEGKRETFKHAILIEEGHHVLSEKKERAEGAETIMETCLRQIREFGEAVIVIDQEPSKLSNSIKANTYTKITFGLGNGVDIRDMATCMNLTREEEDALDRLQLGHGVVSLKGRVQTPLHVGFPLSAIRKGTITDHELLHRPSRSAPSTASRFSSLR